MKKSYFKNLCSSVFTILCFSFIFSGCTSKKQDSLTDVPNVVTADIQAGIEKHIENQTRIGNGYYKIKTKDKDYRFKLVRIHTEYLANLGPRRHFACVDMVDTSGDVYDVDFFLTGDPDTMSVTETTLHKLNGKPFYTWKQKWNGTWKRVPVKDASNELLGIITGEDRFEFKYFVTIPEISEAARIWIPFPVTDRFQEVKLLAVRSPKKYRILTEKKYGNKIFYSELDPEDSGKIIDIRYQVKRKEKSAYDSMAGEAKKYLSAEKLVPINNNFRSIAKQVIKDKKGDLVRARALYDHVIEQMRYMKLGEGWGQGDAVYACNANTGNCTDFHAYFIALARSVGIPARFAIGAAIPSSRNEGGVDGYHCWVEFHAEGKWWPVDISEADKYSSLSTYYFGHHPANRIEFSRGRDLIVEPGPVSGSINFLAYPLFEVGKKQVKISVMFSFKRQS